MSTVFTSGSISFKSIVKVLIYQLNKVLSGGAYFCSAKVVTSDTKTGSLKMLTFNFIPFPELTTERVLLRKITMDDAPAIYFLRSDEAVLRFIGKEPATSLKEAEEFIQRISTFIENNETIMWAISLLDDPALAIGTICFWRLQPENYRAEIGYALHPAYWRKGIMKESIQKVIEYGFETMKLHSIEARISEENVASASILDATGFVKEAHLKEEFYFRGNFLDTIIFSRINK
jgi:[ribosomal protein S5]-alanine N-acetyltransferase